nr:PREDICTED: solute carrier family 25 member 35-like [Bemisia tabaci]XP_018908140.1 PREDICTED: solute carrier family 25 member 35-like [Bemisia tabaci]
MEFLIGGTAASTAMLFTNPMEVVKTRFQLQGELKAKGCYQVHYRNVVHAFYIIAKTDGILGLQGGLGPAMGYQMVLNGMRLGIFQVAEEKKWLAGPTGEISVLKTLGFSVLAGGIGGFISSPFYMIKVQLQAKANEAIAVGHQHGHESATSALVAIFKEHGVRGLFRGSTAGICRIVVATCAQFPSFNLCKEYLRKHQIFSTSGGFLDSCVAAMVGGVSVTFFMLPFDVVATRFYNQGVDASGRGILYKNIIECMVQCFKKEGLTGLYKGFVPCYFRLGPYNLLTFVFWDILKDMQKKYLPPAESKRS